MANPSLSFPFSKAPRLTITRYMPLTRSGKTVPFCEAWTKSEPFRAAHSRAGDHKPLFLDPPQFEGLEFGKR